MVNKLQLMSAEYNCLDIGEPGYLSEFAKMVYQDTRQRKDIMVKVTLTKIFVEVPRNMRVQEESYLNGHISPYIEESETR